MPKTANRISFLIDSQLPDFINEEYELFGKFIQKYYEQLEIQGQPYDIIENLETYRDIDFYEQNLLRQHDTLDVAITNSSDTIVLQDATSFPKQGGYVKIDDEIITYTGKTATSFTGCVRGFCGITTYRTDGNNGELSFNTTDAAAHEGNLYDSTTGEITREGSKIQNLTILFLKEFLKNL